MPGRHEEQERPTLKDANDIDRAHAKSLVVFDGASSRIVVLPSAGELVIGRASTCDVLLSRPGVSRKHASILVADRLHVLDHGSANGVFLKGRKIPANRPTPLNIGEAFEIEGTLFVISPESPKEFVHSDDQPRPTEVAARSSAMQSVLRLIDRIAPSDVAILLLGETGVGKERMAERIHACSARRAGPFLKLNCAALSPALLESELFGYERGAFSGAVSTKPGLLETAQGGTVLLDEVGEMSLELQAKLLRVLEEQRIMRVGGLAPRQINVRFLSATNRDLLMEARAGRFRADLYYRLQGVRLEIPPLRDRREDILPLARGFLLDADGVPSRSIDVQAATVLERYSWPGNVRELKNVIDRARLLATAEEILVRDLPPEILAGNDSAAVASPSDRPLVPSPPAAESADDERNEILRVLAECGGNQTRAAEQLGFSRRTLVNRLAKLDIPRPKKR